MVSNAAIILIFSCFWRRNICVYICIFWTCIYIYIYVGNERKNKKYIFLRTVKLALKTYRVYGLFSTFLLPGYSVNCCCCFWIIEVIRCKDVKLLVNILSAMSVKMACSGRGRCSRDNLQTLKQETDELSVLKPWDCSPRPLLDTANVLSSPCLVWAGCGT